MTNALKIASVLLSYPTHDVQRAKSDILQAVAADTLTGPREKKLLGDLAIDIASRDLYDAQERYVLLFDRSRSLSLHLFEHVHGESRDRGQAMVDLKTMYEQSGFEIDAKELPDYLPLFLEYLSLLPENVARELLGDTAHIYAALRERLRKRKSVYVNAFRVLEVLAKGKADQALVNEILKEPDDDPEDLEALDNIWEDEIVTFGGGAGNQACGPDRLQRQFRAFQRPAGDLPTKQTN